MKSVPSPACQQRTTAFRRGAFPLPGRTPQDNQRPMNVGLAHDRVPLHVFLTTRHPHIAVGVWQRRMQDGRLSIDGRVVRDWDQHVRAGMRVVHTIAQEIEPDVNVDVTFIYEDNALAVLSKPAPLAVHPCGRYNRNSLMPLLGRIYRPALAPRASAGCGHHGPDGAGKKSGGRQTFEPTV